MSIKEYWPEMSRNLPASVQETAKKFGAKAIRHQTRCLVDVLGVHPEGPAKGGLKVTYHECLPPEIPAASASSHMSLST
ncbi:MAG: hypothetical protein V8Q91_17020 [Bilophila wadsworthia]|uniref:hypothetical protein n=1 Tax=Bilophila wadsworthia TaxID=35833 RepID=UPI00300EF344